MESVQIDSDCYQLCMCVYQICRCQDKLALRLTAAALGCTWSNKYSHDHKSLLYCPKPTYATTTTTTTTRPLFWESRVVLILLLVHRPHGVIQGEGNPPVQPRGTERERFDNSKYGRIRSSICIGDSIRALGTHEMSTNFIPIALGLDEERPLL